MIGIRNLQFAPTFQKTELGNVSGVTEANASLRLDDWKELVGQLQESLQRYEGENSVLQEQKDALRAELVGHRELRRRLYTFGFRTKSVPRARS